MFGMTMIASCVERDCEGICDIKVEAGGENISKLYIEVGRSVIESKYIDGEWDIHKMFTMDKPLLPVLLSYHIDYIGLETKNDENIVISWKKICYKKLSIYHPGFEHDGFTMRYACGIGGAIKSEDSDRPVYETDISEKIENKSF